MDGSHCFWGGSLRPIPLARPIARPRHALSATAEAVELVRLEAERGLYSCGVNRAIWGKSGVQTFSRDLRGRDFFVPWGPASELCRDTLHGFICFEERQRLDCCVC